jgi:hypothetical protein
MRDEITECVERGIRHFNDKAANTRELTAHHRAVEIGLSVGTVAGQRPYRVDSAELIGFIRLNDPDGTAEASVLASAIVDRFGLDG